jgi:hypothetical protein
LTQSGHPPPQGRVAFHQNHPLAKLGGLDCSSHSCYAAAGNQRFGLYLITYIILTCNRFELSHVLTPCFEKRSPEVRCSPTYGNCAPERADLSVSGRTR